jgi:2-succinyl-6-hydroxy-2,4-cyclohexadiene-1-carboxylate synthase
MMELKLNGITYSYMIKGEGHPFLLLHGFTGCKENWSFLVDLLSKNFMVIALDLIGHGSTQSPEDPDRYMFEPVCEDIDVLLEKLQIENVHLLGYSMGGRIALAFTILYPNRVTSLILESSSPGLKTEEERANRMESDKKLANDILQHGMTAFVDRWEEIPLFQSQRKLLPTKRTKIREQRLRNNPLGLANSLRGMGTGKQPSYWDKLSTLHIPAFFICGELDRKFCYIAEEMARRVRQSSICQVFQAGHAIHVEQPEFFGKIVVEFLQSFNNKED